MTGSASNRILAAASLALLLGAALTACNPTLSQIQLRQQIQTQCAPVEDLLRDNIRAGGQVRVAGIAGVGGVYETNGAILASAEATQIAKMDEACRAWVAGVFTDEQYADVMVQVFAGAISLTSPVDQQAARIAEALRGFEEISGSLPGRLPTAAQIAQEVRQLNTLTPAEVTQALDPQFDAVTGRLESQSETLAEIVARLDFVEQMVANDPSRTPGDRPDVVTRQNGVDVYFATNSAELTHSAAEALSQFGRVWSAQGRLVDIVGSADARGSPALNDQLSRARAEAVAQALSASGVGIRNLSGTGAEAGPPQGYARARRVQVLLIAP
jgi:outer membrane protein OmpA-like peptidoglycan-associated protein